ncbi:Phenazine biosynthesis-like domain-containing protein 2 [Bagarius yarrelli]|uniref:Phenazine biosynthesis-like domain-containing protein 2 n=1 Tax=Bagarius yarrelli TaxID=175774 RepID=A0A556TML8_BAGYA|nr:Phenazine biosynthesis-like domain-containing protein 2 [Bagarius yarrelli]
MEIPIYTVDAFTNLPFKGNPAAVCLLENALKEDLYQNIAAEMNLSETAFITKLQPNEDFTSGNTNSVLAFETLSGELLVRQRGESLVMDFPLNKPEVQAAVGDLPIQEVCYCKTTKKLLVRLLDTCDRSVLTSLNPVTGALLKSEDSGRINSLIITVKGAPTLSPGYDFYSRNFAPWLGVAEDPVTGSAHTVLAAYWSEKLGKKKMLAYQCSRRGGELELELIGDKRVDIAGRAVVLLQGTLTL